MSFNGKVIGVLSNTVYKLLTYKVCFIFCPTGKKLLTILFCTTKTIQDFRIISLKLITKQCTILGEKKSILTVHNAYFVSRDGDTTMVKSDVKSDRSDNETPSESDENNAIK